MPSSNEVRIIDAETGGQKGQKLARFDLLPWDVMTELAEHYGRGAEKYEDRNWERGYRWSLSFAALHRHLSAWWGGEDVDTETGNNHLAAVLWHAGVMRWFQMHGRGTDDRPNGEVKKGRYEAAIEAAPNPPPKRPMSIKRPANHQPRIYIAGPMRGIPLHNFPAFDKAAELFRGLGWKVISPADLDREMGYDPSMDPDRSLLEAMMRRDFSELVTCDAIALLPGWPTSEGANAELAAAMACGITVLDATNGEPYKF